MSLKIEEIYCYGLMRCCFLSCHVIARSASKALKNIAIWLIFTLYAGIRKTDTSRL